MCLMLDAETAVQVRGIEGLSIRFAESPRRGDDALLLARWPESLLAFQPIWASLGQHVHLVAIDLPGFGHSERRESLLSPRAMSDFVVRVADAFQLQHPHVVGLDIGAAASLFAAASHPDRFRTLVVGGGGAAVPVQLGGALKDWIEAPDLNTFRRLEPRRIVGGALATIERYALPELVREDYLSAYDGDRFVESMRYVRAYPTELPELGARLPDVQTPVLIIAGAHDRAVLPSNAEAGPSDGHVAMLLHGWPYDIHSFVDVAPLLAANGDRVIVPYLRGYGTTTFLSPDTFRNAQPSVVALDIVALMDALQIDQAVFGAFDWERGQRTSSRRSGRNA